MIEVTCIENEFPAGKKRTGASRGANTDQNVTIPALDPGDLISRDVSCFQFWLKFNYFFQVDKGESKHAHVDEKKNPWENQRASDKHEKSVTTELHSITVNESNKDRPLVRPHKPSAKDKKLAPLAKDKKKEAAVSGKDKDVSYFVVSQSLIRFEF